MKKLNFIAPLNPLSFGQVSYNILRELFNRDDIEVAYIPIGNIDLSPYSPSQEFVDKLNQALSKKYSFLSEPSLRLWHFSDGGECRHGVGPNYLFTFHETSEITEFERNVAKVPNRVIVSSSYTRSNLLNSGIETVDFVPLGFDPDFRRLSNPKKLIGRTHWGLTGKFEKRKNTAKIIQNWIKKYGNNNKHHLTCAVINPFVNQDQLHAMINESVFGNKPFNVQFIGHMKLNAQVNDFINSIDIDLSGLSSSEGWGLPSFNATCLGKWSCVHNVTAMKDWATPENSILIEPSGETERVHDGIHFLNGAAFNQGEWSILSDEQIQDAFIRAEGKIGQVNEAGIETGKNFTYKNTVNNILNIIYE